MLANVDIDVVEPSDEHSTPVKKSKYLDEDFDSDSDNEVVRPAPEQDELDQYLNHHFSGKFY